MYIIKESPCATQIVQYLHFSLFSFNLKPVWANGVQELDMGDVLLHCVKVPQGNNVFLPRGINSFLSDGKQ